MGGKVLDVKFFTQLDNWGVETRTCNTSACWMAGTYLKPDLLTRAGYCANADFSFYLPIVNNFGDTTEHDAQTAALRKLGVESEWRTNLTIEDVVAEIDAGRPVVMGWLHKGHVSRPSGFGHMICIVGYEWVDGRLFLIVHDPYGEADLVNGDYYGMPIEGAFLRYSERNLRPRFECDDAGYFAPGNGYGRIFAGV